MSWKDHFPSDRELDDIKQLLDTRTIHLQLGCNPDVETEQTLKVIEAVEKRMRDIFGEHAVREARRSMSEITAQQIYEGHPGTRAFHSMYDTALMRIWWEKFGDTVELRRGASVGEASGRLGADDGADADTPAQLHEAAHAGLDAP